MKKIICFMLVFVLLATIPMMSIAAKSQSDLQSEKNQTEKDKTEVEEQQKQVKSQITEAMQEIAELSSQIQSYENEIAALDKDISNLEEELEETEKELKTATKNCEEQDERVRERLVLVYEEGTTSYLDVLLNSTSLIDLISNYYLITEVAEKDVELLEQLEASKQKVEEAKKKIEDDKAKLESNKEAKVTKSQALETAKKEKDTQVSQLSAEEKELQKKIDDYEESIRDLEKQIQSLATSSDSKVNSSYNGSGMIWPTPNCKYITSPYGPRNHPVFGYDGFHTGIDIGASNKSAVVAVQDGVVTLASYNGGYGKCVMINHGGGISTLYGHASSLAVKVGQTVKQGQTIMYVGSTGVSTAPHLHFEVRVNGQHVQPINYLP